MKRLALHWQILFGLSLGIVYSVISSLAGWSKFTIDWISPWGDIFMRLLKLIAVPLVLFSIIGGIASLHNITRLGRLGIKTLGFYVITTSVAVALGLTLVNTIRPGERIDDDTKSQLTAELQRQMDDPASADARFFAERLKAAEGAKDQPPMQFIVELFPENVFFSMTNNLFLLQVIVFAILFGIALIMVPNEKARPVVAVVDGITEAVIKLVEIIMKAAPFFVFALLAGLLAKMAPDDPTKILDLFAAYAWYAATVLIGLALLVLVFYPLIVRLFIKKIPYRGFFKGIRPAQLVAFSTSSSAATLPVTMECVQDNLGVSKQVSSFVLPIGATVNMDGTSLYQAITAVFLAQFFAEGLTIGEQLIIMGTCVIVSIGTPAVPSAGLVMLIIVLEAIGLPAWWVMLIFPIDRPLDMCRTVVNITGDSTAAAVVAYSEGELNYPVPASAVE